MWRNRCAPSGGGHTGSVDAQAADAPFFCVTLHLTHLRYQPCIVSTIYCGFLWFGASLKRVSMALNSLVGSRVVGSPALLLRSCDSAHLRRHTPSPSVSYPKQSSYRTVVRSSRLPLNPREAREMSEGREPERPNAGGGGGPNPLRFFQNFKDNLFADHKRIQREKNLPKGDLLYKVESGDTLYDISDRHDCSLELLMEANGIDNPNFLQVGQEIWIPRTYQIRKGDTLYSISKHYGVSIEAIQKANGIDDPNFIHEGDHIVFPENTDHKDSSTSLNDMLMED